MASQSRPRITMGGTSDSPNRRFLQQAVTAPVMSDLRVATPTPIGIQGPSLSTLRPGTAQAPSLSTLRQGIAQAPSPSTLAPPESTFGPQQFEGLRQDIAERAFSTAVSPLRRSFQENLDYTVGDLARRGIAFGGVGQESLGDVLSRQGEAEAGISGQIGTALGQSMLQQAMAANEAARGRDFAREQQAGGYEFAREGRDFTREQQAAGYDFAREGREFTREQQAGGYDFAREQEAREAQQREQQRQYQTDIMATELAQRGLLTGRGADEALGALFGEGTQLRTEQGLDLKEAALAAGLSEDDFMNMRETIGEEQYQLIQNEVEEFIRDPKRERQFQERLAYLGAPKGGKVVCTELHRQGLLDSKIYQADSEYAKLIPVSVVTGYHFWGIPLSKLMRKSKLVTTLVRPFATAWAYSMAYKMGATNKRNIFGEILEFIGIPICHLLGSLIKKEKMEYGT